MALTEVVPTCRFVDRPAPSAPYSTVTAVSTASASPSDRNPSEHSLLRSMRGFQTTTLEAGKMATMSETLPNLLQGLKKNQIERSEEKLGSQSGNGSRGFRIYRNGDKRS